LNSPIIDRVVEAVATQDGFREQDEILVVGKDKPGLLGSAAASRLIDTGQPVDSSTAHNLGIEAAHGDLLIFLDSDCLRQMGWLMEHRAAHEAVHGHIAGNLLDKNRLMLGSGRS
jgi:hypothetical protein